MRADRRRARPLQRLLDDRADRWSSRSRPSPTSSSSPSRRSTSSPPRWRTPRTSSAPARCAPPCASRCRWCCPPSSAGYHPGFLEAIALFGAPALIALPARFNVVTTQLWQFFEYPVRVEVAAAYAMPLLLITVALFWLQRRCSARKGYVSLTGKGGERRLIALGPLALGDARLCAVRLRALGVRCRWWCCCRPPSPRPGAAASRCDNLTLEQFPLPAVRADPARQAIINTFLYSAGSRPSSAMGLALAIAYIVQRAAGAASAACWPSCAWRPSSSRASCWRSASMPPTRRRRWRCTARQRS